ncbi:DUF4190 domain-containing protein [Streptomyces griseoviridis]|uniref:DUF4190 domain-containing protein n=1 Tax=Streptomyces griseoviridis TaxID=45398 RepID=A0A3Q9L209_STRGD|nr:DUF4190 domain-containing protein [Streptomyces griseoviridis]QCN90802.1 hypothetical protein DDJ31_27960 [Streptomyces griseoviridis]
MPPPPIAPGGPGQPAYGYPGGYGYPTAPGYGAQGVGGYPAWAGGMTPPPSNGMGTAALVLGILAAVGFCFWPLAIVLGVLALIFGGIGRAKATRGEATNPGVALAGMICGGFGVLFGIGMFTLVFASF